MTSRENDLIQETSCHLLNNLTSLADSHAVSVIDSFVSFSSLKER